VPAKASPEPVPAKIVRYRISAAALGGVAAKFYPVAFNSALHVPHGEVALVRAVYAASVLLQEQHVLALAAEELDVDVPAGFDGQLQPLAPEGRPRLGGPAKANTDSEGTA